MVEFPVPVTALYAGLNALIMLGLACAIPPQRIKKRIGLGHGGDARLEQAIRAHANNTEHVPMALLLIGLLELMAAPLWLLHALGAALTLARLAHAQGLYQTPLASPGRFVGTVFTWTVMGIGALTCLYYSTAV